MPEVTPIFEIAVFKKLFIQAVLFTVVKVVSEVQSTTVKVDRYLSRGPLAGFDQTFDFAIQEEVILSKSSLLVQLMNHVKIGEHLAKETERDMMQSQ